MELRWILAVITVLVIAGLLFDAWRRARARKPAPSLQSPRTRERDDEVDFNPELPGGRARVVRREPVLGGTSAAPVPARAAGGRHAPAAESGPAAGAAVEAVAAPAVEAAREPVVRHIEQVDMFGDVEIPAGEPAPAREIQQRGELPRREGAPRAGTLREPVAPRPAAGTARAAAAAADKPKKAPPEEVIVLHVMGGQQRLDGKGLLQAVLDCGMRFGEYNIFHRYESGAHDAPAVFSMANAVEPGVFDLDAMEGQSFVGVSFFLMLPGPANSRQALDTMVEAARRVARDLNGELHDQQHSVLTPQTIEHLRQRVMEFERRRLAQQRVNG